MDPLRPRFDTFPQINHEAKSTVLSLVSGLTILYLILLYFSPSFPPPPSLLLDALVFIIPQRLLLHRAQSQELKSTGMLSHTHAAKREALQGMLGLGSATLISKLPAGAGESLNAVRRASTSMFSRPRIESDVPAGLGNWDNSCYQNCVLQGLASLDNFKMYLGRLHGNAQSTNGALLETIDKLQDPINNGQQLWTPAKLKSMSSWQQQDAQEYYSKILDEIDKEASKAWSVIAQSTKQGLESLVNLSSECAKSEEPSSSPKKILNPIDGLLAQQVTCIRCGHSDGLSMIPFNCITLPLPLEAGIADVNDCFDEYTAVEEINGVECAKCSLLHARERLRSMLPDESDSVALDSETPAPGSSLIDLPPALRAQAFQRLQAVQEALESDDFTDKTLDETCKIGKKARVSSTKTKQALIARAPDCLVIHINRSVFDERTGVQRKNYARVQYPLHLDVKPWTINAIKDIESNAGESVRYGLKAVVTHYGRHENGHYICYRQHPKRGKVNDVSIEEVVSKDSEAEITTDLAKPWYRLSDEDVSSVTAEDVLNQGGVFMLFYERLNGVEISSTGDIPQTCEAKLITASAPVEALTTAGAAEEVRPTHDLELTEEGIRAESGTLATSDSENEYSRSSSPLPQPSTEATTEDEYENDVVHDDDPKDQTSPQPVRMRTAGAHHLKSDFAGSTFRLMAST